MASLKEIRARIGSVTSTLKITSAMKMVSAAKLHKAEERTLSTVPYKNKLTEVLARYLDSIEDENYKVSLSVERKVKKVLLVPIASSSGLCGAFNSNISKLLKKKVIEHQEAGHSVIVMPVGKKIADSLKFTLRGLNVETDFSNISICEKPNYNVASQVAEALTEDFTKGKFDRVELLYNHFKNTGTQIPTEDQFLPLPKIEAKGNTNRLYFVEPDAKTFVENLVPIVVKLMFYATLLDSSTAEFGARTTAMQIASDNAETLLGEITQLFNRLRQESITTDLIDVVGGAEAQRN
ncbi:MAG: ATP synthase F1 subunit gamma [Paludibacteraceae bacterium]|nr:ATP synthase F1 subunit gamma [Paludibacteraceae bacterium]